MEIFKLRIFESEHQGRPFPEHRSLPPDISRRLRQTLAERARSNVVEGTALLKVLSESSRPIEHANAKSEGFDLATLVDSLELEPQE